MCKGEKGSVFLLFSVSSSAIVSGTDLNGVFLHAKLHQKGIQIHNRVFSLKFSQNLLHGQGGKIQYLINLSVGFVFKEVLKLAIEASYLS